MNTKKRLKRYICRLPFEFIDFQSVVLTVDKIVEQTGCAKMFLKALHSSLHAVL